MKDRKYIHMMYDACDHAENQYELEKTVHEIIDGVRSELKDLKPHEYHLGHGDIIDMKGIYNHHSLDDGWQMRSDNSGEYRDTIYYSYDAARVLELISLGYAELDSIEPSAAEKEAYYFRMRRNY